MFFRMVNKYDFLNRSNILVYR